MSGWKKGDTNKLCINQILLGFCIGGFCDFAYRQQYIPMSLCIALGFLNYYHARHKSPK